MDLGSWTLNRYTFLNFIFELFEKQQRGVQLDEEEVGKIFKKQMEEIEVRK